MSTRCPPTKEVRALQRLHGLSYEATGILVGANGDARHGTVVFDQGRYGPAGWTAADPADHLGDVCAAYDDDHRPLDTTTLPAAFFPWRFRPDAPLPSAPYDCSLV